jgi:hypothetical protein
MDPPAQVKRREQLRTSQKTYRNRKRQEHDRLQKRVDELEKGVHDINHEFLNISKLLLDTQAAENRPHLSSALRDVTRQCLSLAEIVQASASACREISENASSHSNCSQVNDLVDQSDAKQMIDYKPMPSRADIVQAIEWPLVSTFFETCHFGQSSSPFGNQSILPISPTSTLPPQFAQTLYPGEGAEFAHRLVRQCCLTAYQLLVHMPDLPRTQEIFGYVPPPSSRSQMASSLFNAILADDLESLQNRAQALSFLDPKDITPPTIPLASNSTKVAIESFTMRWLDAYGVQKIISEKGIRLQEGILTSEASPSRSVSSSIHLDIRAFINCKTLET